MTREDCFCGANLGFGTHRQDECRVGAAITRRFCGGCLEPGCPNCWTTADERMDADPIGPPC